MLILIIIAIAVPLIILAVLLISNALVNSNTLWHFKHCNVLVAGKKGSGKDLLFQWVINKRADYYYSNIGYGGLFKKIKLKQVSCEPNDYDHIVNDKIEKQPHYFREKCDIYISDIGIYLPSYMDSKLYAKFPSMPIYYALSRHLANNNVHCNTQNIERGWKALREQADFYIQVKRTYKILGFIFITKYYSYDRYESARQQLNPLRARVLNKYSKAEADIYKAQNGTIQRGFIIQFKKQLKYDTRAMEKILLKGKRKK